MITGDYIEINDMNTRQQNLLRIVIENYIETAEPVGSKFLVENTDLGVSGATIRNEMRALEEEGFLTHPHTSAGRIPTESGYQFYVENLMGAVEVKKKVREELTRLARGEKEKSVKDVSKYIAELISNAVIVAFNRDDVYYTGMANLFSQPEFRDYDNLASVSSIFDHCEEQLDDLFETIGGEISILIGQKNPFGSACGLVAGKFNNHSLFAIVGPIRMDYGQGVGLVRWVKEIV